MFATCFALSFHAGSNETRFRFQVLLSTLVNLRAKPIVRFFVARANDCAQVAQLLLGESDVAVNDVLLDSYILISVALDSVLFVVRVVDCTVRPFSRSIIGGTDETAHVSFRCGRLRASNNPHAIGDSIESIDSGGRQMERLRSEARLASLNIVLPNVGHASTPISNG